MITETNSHRFIALCDVEDCAWSTSAIRIRMTAAIQLRDHNRTEHNVKTAKSELPEQPDAGDRLSEFAGHLIVVGPGWRKANRKTQFGDRPAVEADLWVLVDGGWKNLVDAPIYFKSVIAQLDDAGNDEAFGGKLVQGTERNPREWIILPPLKAEQKLLDEWDPSF